MERQAIKMETIASKLIQIILDDYAHDSIVHENKFNILNFFNRNHIFYRDDHVNFLSQFGGAETKFFNSIGINCTFNQIKELYIEGHSDNTLLSGFAYFGVDDVGVLCISQETGKIYYQKIDEDENPSLGELCFCNIKSFLFISLLSYLNVFAKEKSFKKNLKQDEIFDIEKKLSSHFLEDIQDEQMKYFLKNNTLYSLNYEKGYVYQHELSLDFYKKLSS